MEQKINNFTDDELIPSAPTLANTLLGAVNSVGVKFEVTLEIAKQYISKKSTEISDPFWFDFDDAVENEIISDELAKKMQEFVFEYPFFKKKNDSFCIDNENGGTFSESSIDLICDVLITNFLSDLIPSYQDYTEYSGYCSLRSWFINAVVDGVGYTECDEKEYCNLSYEVLNSFPCNSESIIDELDILLTNKHLNQDDWNWLELVACNPHVTKIENRLIKIVKKFGK